MSDDKNPVDRLLDVLVFAPLGLVLEARQLLPKMAERGRQHANMARMVGEFAVKQGQREAGKRLEQVAKRPGPPPQPAVPPSHPSASASGSADPLVATIPEPNGPLTAPVDEIIPIRRELSPDVAPTVAKVQAALGISDYDSLSASQVVPRLAGLLPVELEAVRAYELTHRSRRTILSKIAQLQV